jgi:hypothetical protein
MSMHAALIIAARGARDALRSSLDVRSVSDRVRVMSGVHPQLSCRPQGVR